MLDIPEKALLQKTLGTIDAFQEQEIPKFIERLKYTQALNGTDPKTSYYLNISIESLHPAIVAKSLEIYSDVGYIGGDIGNRISQLNNEAKIVQEEYEYHENAGNIDQAKGSLISLVDLIVRIEILHYVSALKLYEIYSRHEHRRLMHKAGQTSSDLSRRNLHASSTKFLRDANETQKYIETLLTKPFQSREINRIKQQIISGEIQTGNMQLDGFWRAASVIGAIVGPVVTTVGAQIGNPYVAAAGGIITGISAIGCHYYDKKDAKESTAVESEGEVLSPMAQHMKDDVITFPHGFDPSIVRFDLTDPRNREILDRIKSILNTVKHQIRVPTHIRGWSPEDAYRRWRERQARNTAVAVSGSIAGVAGIAYMVVEGRK